MMAWFNRYTHGLTAVTRPASAEKPAECARGPCQMSAASMAHDAASPTYSGQRDPIDCFHDEKRKTRSYSTTISGAVAIDSLQAMPKAHAARAAGVQMDRPRASALRMLAYSVSR